VVIARDLGQVLDLLAPDLKIVLLPVEIRLLREGGREGGRED